MYVHTYLLTYLSWLFAALTHSFGRSLSAHYFIKDEEEKCCRTSLLPLALKIVLLFMPFFYCIYVFIYSMFLFCFYYFAFEVLCPCQVQ